MNFLELCKRTREEVGYSGAGPSSVTGQVGEMGRLVSKVNSAWLEIQQARAHWAFMKKSVNAAVSLATLSVPDLKSIDEDSFYILDAGVQHQLIHTTQDALRYAGSLTAMPSHFWHERGILHFWPIPDRAYAVIGDYFKTPALMPLENTAVPPFPEEYHEAIVWLAAKHLGAFEEAGNTYNHCAAEFRRIFSKMLDSETPSVYFGGPMA